MSDPNTNTSNLRVSLAVYAAAEPTLELLVFLGSSSRGDAGGGADLELGYVASAGFDHQTFRELAAIVLDRPHVAMADLRRAPTTAFRAAREGALVFERTPGGFRDFRERAIHNWCDLAPVLNAAFDRLDSGKEPAR